MRERFDSYVEGQDEVEVDIDTASLVDMPLTLLTPTGETTTHFNAQTLLLPVWSDLIRDMPSHGMVRTQVNAVLIDGTPHPIIAIQADTRAIACVFEPGDEDGRRLFDAAREHGFLPVCLFHEDCGKAIKIEWTADTEDLHSRIREHSPLSTERYAYSVAEAMRGALDLVFARQPAALRPRRIGLRILASQRRMASVVDAARVELGLPRMH